MRHAAGTFIDLRLGSVEALEPPASYWRVQMATAKPQTKADTVIALLDRAKGATLDEICKATNWQPHSARAFMTGLRKRGFALAREERAEEGTSYRITARSYAEDASV